MPAVIGPQCQAPAGVIQGPGTLADICGGAAQKAADGQGSSQAACCRGTCYGAKATVVPLPKLRVWGMLQCFLLKMDLFYKAKIGNIKLAQKKEKKKEKEKKERRKKKIKR